MAAVYKIAINKTHHYALPMMGMFNAGNVQLMNVMD